MQDIAEDLLLEASKGEIEAFEQIYTHFSGFVYSVSRRVTGSDLDAQEITQDVFMKIYNNLKKFEIGTSFKSWIYRITVNLSINRYNKIKKQKSRFLNSEIALNNASQSGETEKNIELESNKYNINKLLNLLNEDQKICILLREIHGLNYKEIADSLKININTVRTRLSRAREILLKRGKEVIKNEL